MDIPYKPVDEANTSPAGFLMQNISYSHFNMEVVKIISGIQQTYLVEMPDQENRDQLK